MLGSRARASPQKPMACHRHACQWVQADAAPRKASATHDPVTPTTAPTGSAAGMAVIGRALRHLDLGRGGGDHRRAPHPDERGSSRALSRRGATTGFAVQHPAFGYAIPEAAPRLAEALADDHASLRRQRVGDPLSKRKLLNASAAGILYAIAARLYDRRTAFWSALRLWRRFRACRCRPLSSRLMRSSCRAGRRRFTPSSARASQGGERLGGWSPESPPEPGSSPNTRWPIGCCRRLVSSSSPPGSAAICGRYAPPPASPS